MSHCSLAVNVGSFFKSRKSLSCAIWWSQVSYFHMHAHNNIDSNLDGTGSLLKELIDLDLSVYECLEENEWVFLNLYVFLLGVKRWKNEEMSWNEGDAWDFRRKRQMELIPWGHLENIRNKTTYIWLWWVRIKRNNIPSPWKESVMDYSWNLACWIVNALLLWLSFIECRWL